MTVVVRAGILVLVAAPLAAGCGFKMEKILAPYADIEVREIARSLYCPEGDEPGVRLFADPAAVRAWAGSRDFALPEALSESPHVLVAMGQRPTGGYGLAVSRSAVLRGGLVILKATFISPAPGRPVTQALTSPCVLVQLPPGRYSAIEVQDQTGSVRISASLPEGSAAAPAE